MLLIRKVFTYKKVDKGRGMTRGDRFEDKYLSPNKKEREILRKAYREGDYKPLAKRIAIGAGALGAVVGGAGGILRGEGAKGALAGALILGSGMAAAGYVGTRLRKVSDRVFFKDRLRRQADLIDLADGKISEEEYASRHRH